VAKFLIGPAIDLPPGTRKLVEIAGRSIGVFNVGGEFFALRNRCPHQGGPLCEGRLAGLVESDGPGDLRYSRPGEILRCPWHAWEYDIRTGQSYFNPAVVRVRQFEVSVEEGSDVEQDNPAPVAEVAVVTGVGTRTAGLSRILKGPFVAETYPVSVDDQYLIVEIDE
jgi:3-phenylpropionate/trans-cinnamate dioxygenase ferredoxin subunit